MLQRWPTNYVAPFPASIWGVNQHWYLETGRRTQTDTDRQTQTDTDSHRQTHTDTDRHRQTQTDTDRQRMHHFLPLFLVGVQLQTPGTKYQIITQAEPKTGRRTQTDTDRHRQTPTGTDRHRQTQTTTDRHRQT